MTRDENILYHQIHPLKLLTDVSMAIGATFRLWKGPLILKKIEGKWLIVLHITVV